MKVKDIMQKDVLTLRVDDHLDIVENVMTLGRIRHLPIVDQHERLVGILTQRDLLRASVASVLELRRSAEREWLVGLLTETDCLICLRHLLKPKDESVEARKDDDLEC